MRGFDAALWKDLRLLLRGAGLAALILPLALLLALRVGYGEIAGGVEPFPIAVRDLDGTIMSRSLVSQVRQVALFSQVLSLEEDAPDKDALAEGCAAVITIPKDFFYDMYTMSDCPVDVVLNEEMPLESSLLESILTSVLNIVRADQAAQRGVYAFCYGEITPELERTLFAETADHLFQDALGRQRVFDSQAEAADTQGALERRLAASMLSLLSLFFALSALRTLPEEAALGVLPRFRAAGGGLAGFVCAKFLAALLLLLPGAVMVWAAFSGIGLLPLLGTALGLLFGAFGLVLALAAWTDGAASLQRWGNGLLLLSLVLGGTLWPSRLLPGALGRLSALTLPHYALLALEALGQGEGAPAVLLWPVPAMGLGGSLLAAAGLRRRRVGGTRGPRRGEEAALPPESGGRLRPFALRLAGTAGIKLRAMAGGAVGLAGLLLAAALCGGAAAAVERGGTDALALAVCDLDGSELSRDLTERLENAPGVALTLCGEGEGRRLLLLGEIEGLLTIREGYGETLTALDMVSLGYTASSSAASAQGAREIAAGQVSAQRSRLRAAVSAEERLGRALDETERARLWEEIDRAEESAPLLWRMERASGGAMPDPFLPGRTGFAALAVLLAVLTAAPWSGAEGASVTGRMASLPMGRLLAHGGDCLALAGLGLLTWLAVLLPGGVPGGWALMAGAVYALCGAALAQAAARWSAREGSVDALAPFAALILCLLGGCFLDLREVSPMMARLAMAVPPGLAQAAAEGSGRALAVLAGEGAALFALGLPRRR